MTFALAILMRVERFAWIALLPLFLLPCRVIANSPAPVGISADVEVIACQPTKACEGEVVNPQILCVDPEYASAKPLVVLLRISAAPRRISTSPISASKIMELGPNIVWREGDLIFSLLYENEPTSCEGLPSRITVSPFRSGFPIPGPLRLPTVFRMR